MREWNTLSFYIGRDDIKSVLDRIFYPEIVRLASAGKIDIYYIVLSSWRGNNITLISDTVSPESSLKELSNALSKFRPEKLETTIKPDPISLFSDISSGTTLFNVQKMSASPFLTLTGNDTDEFLKIPRSCTSYLFSIENQQFQLLQENLELFLFVFFSSCLFNVKISTTHLSELLERVKNEMLANLSQKTGKDFLRNYQALYNANKSDLSDYFVSSYRDLSSSTSPFNTGAYLHCINEVVDSFYKLFEKPVYCRKGEKIVELFVTEICSVFGLVDVGTVIYLLSQSMLDNLNNIAFEQL